MKKIDFGAPPPPPPELPHPVPTELYSPTQYSGVQQYSPSRATSPASEDERPPPPTAASLPPRKVLGSDQAKRRLQAFAKSKMTNSPKGKVSAVFADEEDEFVKEKVEKKKVPMVKDSTPVMASIMKEETESRETIKKNMELIARKAEDADIEMRSKEDKNRESKEDIEGDLRELLKKKREEKDLKEDYKSNITRKSRSKERRSERYDKKRGDRSPRDSKNRSSGFSSDKGRKGRNSLSPERNKKGKDRDESPDDIPRSKDRLDKRKAGVKRGLSQERSGKRKNDYSPSTSSDRGASGFGKFGSEKKTRDVLDESPDKQRFTEMRDGSNSFSKRGKDLRDKEDLLWEARDKRKDSSERKIKDLKDSKGDSRRINSGDSKDGGAVRARNQSGDGKRNRKISGDNKKGRSSGDCKGVDLKEVRNSVAETRTGRKIGTDLKDQKSGERKEFDKKFDEFKGNERSENLRERDRKFSPMGRDPELLERERRPRKQEDSWSIDSFQRKRNFSSESKAIMPDLRDQLHTEEKHKDTKNIDLWELKHGNQNQSIKKELNQTSEDYREVLDKEDRDDKDQTIYIKAANDDDYHEVKQEHRDTTGFIHMKDEIFIEFPSRFMRETSSGMAWSYNLETSQSLDLEVKRSAHIRQSIDSMVSELEIDALKKKSRENSVKSDMEGPVKKKKKKRTSKVEELKKDKKKRKFKKEEVSSKKTKKKKKKKDRDIDEDIDLPDISFDLDQSMTSTNTSPDPKRQRVDSGSVPLSAAGVSKLFSMAGYDPSSNKKEGRDEKICDSDSKGRGVPESLSPSPLKTKRKSSRMDQSPPTRSDSRHSKCSKDFSIREEMFSNRSFSSGREEVFTPSMEKRSALVGTPVQDDTELPTAERIVMYENVPRRSLSEKSPSPSLRGDLSRISGPRTPSPGPRLPKMKDSRSPSKVPIMRDRRSPLKQSPVRDTRKKDHSNERGRSLERYESHKKKNSRKSHRSRETSPGGQFLTEEDFIGKNYESLRDKRESPRTSEHSGSAHWAQRSPGRFVSPGSYPSKGSPRGSLCSHKSEDKFSPQKKHSSPDQTSKISVNPDNGKHSRRQPSEENKFFKTEERSSRDNSNPTKRRSSPNRSHERKERAISPGIKYSPINDSRDFSPKQRQYKDINHEVQGRKPFSPSRRDSSPGRRLDSPERRPVSPSRFREDRRPERSQDRRYSSPNRRFTSPRRRTSVSPGKRLASPRYKSPNRRPRTPEKRPKTPDRRPRTPDRRPMTSEERPRTPERRPRTPERRLRTPDRRPMSQSRSLSPSRKPASPGRRAMSSEKRPSSLEKRPSSLERRPVSPGRRPLSPERRPLSPSRRPLSPGRRPLSPGRRALSPGRRPSSPGKRLTSPCRRPSSPNRRPASPNRRVRSPGRGPISPGRRPSSPGRRQLSPDRRPGSPGKSPRNFNRRPFSPDHRPRSQERRQHGSEHMQYSPDRRHISPDRRLRSPRSRDKRPSPGQYSPGRRGYQSPGRARRPHTPPYSPGRRARTPETRRYSPDRRPYSPGRRRFSPSYDPRDRNLPDSTISDADLARQMPPPSLHYKYKQFPALASPAASGYSDSPKRLSLDERLEREHGIKIEHEQTPPMDFTRPPPGFPTVPSPFLPPGISPTGPPLISAVPLSAGLPAMIPTYDDSTPPIPVKGPPYPGSGIQKVASEKEQAIIAAQAVASKLQEMQAAKEDERKKKKEQKMAERMAQLEAKGDDKAHESKALPAKVATGRILEEVEKQESEMKGKDIKEEVKESDKKKLNEEKRKRRKDRDSPLLITLKPFYRPNDKKDKKKRKIEVPDADLTDEEFVPRSPVPLPDNSTLKPVLIKPNQTKLKLVSEASSDKKGVKYADGVLPGQGSPDQDFSPPESSAPPTPTLDKPVKKKYKKVTITVITRHMGDTDSEEDGPPPPPPGSPPRYHLKELIAMYGTPRPVETTA